MKTAIDLIAEERARQIAQEGYDATHDRDHRFQDLAAAGACYAQHVVGRAYLWEWPLCKDFGVPSIEEGMRMYREEPVPAEWPWEDEAWKPKDPARDLLRAGALIAASLDRFIGFTADQRATEPPPATEPSGAKP